MTCLSSSSSSYPSPLSPSSSSYPSSPLSLLPRVTLRSASPIITLFVASTAAAHSSSAIAISP